MAPWPHTMAVGKSIDCCCRKKVGDEKSWPCQRKEMGAEEFRSAECAECINEEGELDGGGGLNEELGDIEENPKGMEFNGMEGHGSLNARNSVEVCNLQLHFGDGGLLLGLDGMVIIS